MSTTHPRPAARATATIAAVAIALGGLIAITAPTAATAIDEEQLSFELLSQPIPTADLLDVDFSTGVAVDVSAAAHALTPLPAVGTIAPDATLGANVATVNGTQAWGAAWTPAQYTAINDGFAIETVFSVSTFSGSYVDLIGNMQSAGAGLEISKDASGKASLEFWAHVGGYKVPKAVGALEYGQWYHAVAVYDGTAARLYLNGELVSSVAASGTMTTPGANSRTWVIGGDITSSGGLEAGFTGSIATARIYGDPIGELDAYRLSRAGLTSLDTIAPLVKPESTPSATGELGVEYVAPAGVAVDDGGPIDDVVVEVETPDGTIVALGLDEEPGRYAFTPEVEGAYVLRYSALDRAGNLGTSEHPIAVGDVTVEPEEPGEEETPSLTFGAIGDIHNEWSELAETFAFWKAEGLEAGLFVGDMTNNGTQAEYTALKNSIDANIGDMELIAALGNHDLYSGIAGYGMFTGATGQAPNAVYELGGYTFITVSPGAGTLNETTGVPSASSTGNYAYARTWLQTRLAETTAAKPDLPVFVLVHHPLQCTHYVSNEWYGSGLSTGCGDNFSSVFDAFPQAVVWGGHIHTPNNISSSIWQDGGFTTVNAPSLAYFEMESGYVGGSVPNDAGNNRQTAVVSVEGSVVEIRNYDLLSDRWIDQTWRWDVAEAVADPSSMPFTDDRATQTAGPVWGEDAAIALTRINDTSVRVTFPQASPAPNSVQDIVHSYQYQVVEVASGVTVSSSKQWSGFYVTPLPTTRGQVLAGLTPGVEYEVRVSPVNTWGKQGEPITLRFTTNDVVIPEPVDPFDQLAAPLPVADLLDVDFGGGQVLDKSPAAHVITAGTAPIAIDPVLDREVATYTANTAQASRIPWSTDDYAAINDGFTVETVFKVDEFSASYVNFFGNMQSAGIGFELSKGTAGTANLELWAHIGGYKVPKASNALQYGQWYHAVGTYDGATVRLYLDGVLVARTPATGTVTTPASASRSWVIGGDITSSGGIEAPFVGGIALARIYGDPVSALQAQRLSAAALTSTDTAAPLVRAAVEPDATGAVGVAYVAPAAEAVDNSGTVVATTITMTGPGGVELPLVDGAFVPTTAGAHVLEYAAEDAAGNVGTKAYEVDVAAGPLAVTVVAGANGTAGADRASALPGETVTLTATPVVGYRLLEWQAPAGVTIGSDGAFTMPESAVTITAVFAPIEYRIEFAAAGGTGAMAPIDAVFGTPVTLPTAAFARDGYDFAGWLVGDGSGTLLQDGAVVSNLTAVHGASVVLTARWVEEGTEPGGGQPTERPATIPASPDDFGPGATELSSSRASVEIVNSARLARIDLDGWEGEWFYFVVYSSPTEVGWVQVVDGATAAFLPASVPAGDHTFALLDADGEAVLFVRDVAVPALPGTTTPGRLSATGSPEIGVASGLAALALVVAGGIAMAVTRRRRAA